MEGELDLLAFEPRTRASDDWTAWESAGGARVVRGGPGSLMFVPAGCPHAFTNPGTAPARMLFLVTPSGHEQYLEGIAELLSHPGPPDQAAIVERGPARHQQHHEIPDCAGPAGTMEPGIQCGFCAVKPPDPVRSNAARRRAGTYA